MGVDQEDLVFEPGIKKPWSWEKLGGEANFGISSICTVVSSEGRVEVGVEVEGPCGTGVLGRESPAMVEVVAFVFPTGVNVVDLPDQEELRVPILDGCRAEVRQGNFSLPCTQVDQAGDLEISEEG